MSDPTGTPATPATPPAPSVDAAIAKGEAALNNLYTLQITAVKNGDVATQKALEDDIDDLRYKLTQLRSQAITADAGKIAALNAQLDKVAATAQASLTDLSKLSDVINAVVIAAKLIDGILSVA